jgi:hypothetical protein
LGSDGLSGHGAAAAAQQQQQQQHNPANDTIYQ